MSSHAADLKPPRPAQRGEVVERSEAGEGLPRFTPEGSRPPPGGATVTTAGAAWLGAAHLIVDAVCVASVLRAAPPSDSIVPGALAFVLGYDLLAFAGQAPFGWLADRLGLRRGAA